MIRKTVTLVTPPTTEPVSLGEVKGWIKVDTNADDALLQTMISAARESAEKYLKRALITQTQRVTLDLPQANWIDALPDGTYDFPITASYADIPRIIELPYKPLQSVTSIVTYDTANTASTYSASNYFVDTANGRVALNSTASWPSNLRGVNAVAVTYVAGYGTAVNVPAAIKSGIMMHVQKMYDERMVCDLPPSCMALYDKFRVYA